MIYADQYLKNLVTPAFEAAAYAEVDAIAAFDTYWRDRLAEIKAYQAVCLASMKAPEDMFTTKLTHYRKEWVDALVQAKAALTTTGASHPGYFSINLERG